jgi:Arc/MetJ family transcription regulator
MRTTLDLPEDLLEKARKATGARTKRETVVDGLRALLRNRAYANLLSLRGKMTLIPEARFLRGKRRR